MKFSIPLLIYESYYDHVSRLVASLPTGHRRSTLHWFCLYYAVCLSLSVRYALTGYYLHIHQESWYFEYDIFFSLLNKERFYEGLFFVTAAGLNLYGLLLHWVVYYAPDVRIWLGVYDLIVLNRDQFFNCNPGLIWKRKNWIQLLEAPVSNLKQFWFIIRSLWTGIGVRFESHSRLRNFHRFPAQVRARVMLIVWCFEGLNELTTLIFGKFRRMLGNSNFLLFSSFSHASRDCTDVHRSSQFLRYNSSCADRLSLECHLQFGVYQNCLSRGLCWDSLLLYHINRISITQ